MGTLQLSYWNCQWRLRTSDTPGLEKEDEPTVSGLAGAVQVPGNEGKKKRKDELWVSDGAVPHLSQKLTTQSFGTVD